jgi:hypothetical protein
VLKCLRRTANYELEKKMKQTYTTDYDEWNNRRERSERVTGTEQLPLSVPANLRTQFKGFAFGPVFLDDDGNAHECKTRVIPEGDSICNYDYSDCYLLDYHIIVYDTRPTDTEHNIDLNAPYTNRTGIRVRYSGQALSLQKAVSIED